MSTTSESEAVFINAKSQVVGMQFACDQLSSNAFLWEQGSIVDLNTLISADSGFQLVWAGYIADNGEIGAFGNLANGDTHAVLLLPCDENHLEVEGCDYSMVEGSSSLRKRPTPSKASGVMPWAAFSRRPNRVAFPLGSRNQ